MLEVSRSSPSGFEHGPAKTACGMCAARYNMGKPTNTTIGAPLWAWIWCASSAGSISCSAFHALASGNAIAVIEASNIAGTIGFRNRATNTQ